MTAPPPAAGAESPHLSRRIGLVQATALNMTNMIGIGPFITIPALMTTMGGPQAMLGWIVALVIALADGMIWSELGAAMPGSGGTYVYLRNAFGRESFGRLMAFLFIWQFVVSGPLEIASGFIGFVQYAAYVLPPLSKLQEHGIKIIVGIIAVVLLYRRISAVGRITVALWVATLFTVGVVIMAGLIYFDYKVAFDFPERPFHFPRGATEFSFGYLLGALGSASRIGMYDYLGYYNICHLGDEVKDPGRVIPRSIIISLIAVAGIYLVMNVAIISVVPWREFVPADGQLADPPPPIVAMFMQRLFGVTVARLFTCLVLITAFASVFALLLGYSRVPYAAARDGSFFSIFGRLHARDSFPHISLLTIGALSIACSFFNLSTVIDALLGTRILVQFIGQIGAVIWLRRTQPSLPRPFRVWLYPIPAVIAFIGWSFLFVTIEQPKIRAFALAVPAAGVVAYLIWAWSLNHWPFAQGAKASGEKAL